MKKPSITQTILCLIIGLLPLTGYYFLMTEYFKVSPFEGYYWIPTIYLIICYVLYPSAVGNWAIQHLRKLQLNLFQPRP